MDRIGVVLKKKLKPNSLLSIFKVYGYAALLSSGAWMISIIALILIGILTSSAGKDVTKYQIVVTYAIAMASSLIVTGLLQLPLTRYIADLIFEKKENEVLPTYFGAIFISLLLGLIFSTPFFMWVFKGFSPYFIVGVIATFLTLSSVWIATIIASGLKYYNEIVLTYFISYLIITILSFFFGNSLTALVYVFFFGNLVLFTMLTILIIKTYNSDIFLKLNFFLDKNFYWSLAIAGLFYNLGSWIDKFIFWYHPLTGQEVLGKLHSSIVYDLPVFLAYLSILPGMAIFFFRLETEFAEDYILFYNAVREGASLRVIKIYKIEMIKSIRHSLLEMMILQSIIDIIIFVTAPGLFSFLHIPQLYLGLLLILIVGAMLQLVFMSILAIMHYLDRKKEAMILSILFFVLNASFTLISIYLGPSFFGYGYTLSLLIVFSISVFMLRSIMRDLDYETFMLQ